MSAPAAAEISVEVCTRTFLLKLQSIQQQAIFIHSLNKGRAADHGYWRASARQHAAEISSDSACADYRDARPVFCLRHVVKSPKSARYSRTYSTRAGAADLQV